MKNNSEVSMRSLMGWISLLGMLGFLVSMSVFASESVINISIDPANAVQHIGSVKIIQVDNAVDHATIGSIGSGLLSVQTKANILLGSGDNQFLDGSIYSTILGGKENVITGGWYSTIIAGVKNGIGGGQANTILGGRDNKIGGSSSFSTIAGGLNNAVAGQYSTIVGGGNNQITGDYSVIVGNKNAVSGNNSVAVGKYSKVNANNSFLWRDSEESYNTGLNVDNVFAVVSRRGMVINASSPNQYAQLTIGGPLVVGMNDNDENAICGSGVGGGTMKTVFMGERYCLCSCDGNSRNSMFGQGQCQSICHGEPMQPVCGTGVDRVACGGVYTFRGTCESGYVVNGTGAYFVDRNNVVHWTCQTSDGTSVACGSSDITQVSNCPENCHHATLGTVLDGHSVTAYLSNNPAGECHGISRTCRNGSLDGDSSYNSPTCNGGCRIPWSNEYIAEGGTIQAYNRNVAPYGESCGNPMIRRCHNGSFDGPDEYKRENCTEETANYCVHEGTKYAHLSNLVTYKAESYQCPEGCNDDVVVGRCYNGMWLNARSEKWKNSTELVEGTDPEQIRVDLYPYTSCVSKDSSNATQYTLAECPSTGGVCMSGTVYYGINNVSYEQDSCTGTVKYKLKECNAGYYMRNGECLQCPTGYTSNTGANAKNKCYLTCEGGQHLSEPKTTSCSNCTGGTYSTQHDVRYGNTSQCTKCTNDRPDNSIHTGGSSGNNCDYACNAGYYRNDGLCKWCGDGYTSNTGATSSSGCYLLPKCGSSNGQYFVYQDYPNGPTSNLCADGSLPQVSPRRGSNGEITNYVLGWNWSCSKEGHSVNCSANRTNSYTSCQGYVSMSNATRGSQSYLGLNQKSWTYVPQNLTFIRNGTSANPLTGGHIVLGSLGVCEWTCNVGYRKDSSNNCVPMICLDRAVSEDFKNSLPAPQNNCSALSSHEYACNGAYEFTAGCDCQSVLGPYNNGCYACLKRNASCFIAGTQVTMLDGTQKNIEDIKIGEKVMGSNGTVNTVLGFHKPLLGEKELWSVNGGGYFVTAEHPFMTTQGWKSLDPEISMQGVDIEVSLLKVGDFLITDNGEVEIYSLESKKANNETQLYNLLLDGDHTYYANGYLVHNKNDLHGNHCMDQIPGDSNEDPGPGGSNTR